jgi:cystathionine beta-synthase
MDRGALMGLVDESDVLVAQLASERAFERPVRDVMTTKVETLRPDAPLSELVRVLGDGMVGVVVDDGALFGLVTRIDLVNYLRRRAQIS